MAITKSTLTMVDNHLLLENESLYVTRTPVKDGKPCGDTEKIDVTMHVAKLLENVLKKHPVPPQSVEENKECDVKPVDLGLPSGTLWADRNLGAKSPSDYGAFVSWGNTDLHFPDKGDVDWGDNDDAFKDYEFTEEEYEDTPGAKLKGDIDLEHDAAHVNLGGNWRMPTYEQLIELYRNCRWIRKTIDGVNGYLVVSKINQASIFLPCSGLGYGSSWYNRGSYGYYWSGSLSSATNGRYLSFGSGGVYPQYGNSRFLGFAVRPVQTSSPNK